MNPPMLPGLTLPPYWMRRALATAGSYRSAMVWRISSTTRPASPGSAVPAGPIAPMGRAALRSAAGPDRPDGLVGDDHGRRLLRVHLIERSPDLLGDLRLGTVGVALLERLAHAQDRGDAVRQRRPHLLVHEQVVLAEELPPLRMADDDVADLERREHQRRDLAGERALVVGIQVLRAERVRDLVGIEQRLH